MILRIMQRHGDGGKKIFITEFGYHDSDFVVNRGMKKSEADGLQASFFPTDFEAFRSCENIETVFIFRLYDWTAGPGIEIDFGLFTSPSSPKGIIPKAKGIWKHLSLDSGRGRGSRRTLQVSEKENTEN